MKKLILALAILFTVSTGFTSAPVVDDVKNNWVYKLKPTDGTVINNYAYGNPFDGIMYVNITVIPSSEARTLYVWTRTSGGPFRNWSTRCHLVNVPANWTTFTALLYGFTTAHSTIYSVIPTWGA